MISLWIRQNDNVDICDNYLSTVFRSPSFDKGDAYLADIGEVVRFFIATSDLGAEGFFVFFVRKDLNGTAGRDFYYRRRMPTVS